MSGELIEIYKAQFSEAMYILSQALYAHNLTPIEKGHKKVHPSLTHLLVNSWMCTTHA
jgi:hypothetical protein